MVSMARPCLSLTMGLVYPIWRETGRDFARETLEAVAKFTHLLQKSHTRVNIFVFCSFSVVSEKTG